MTLWLEKAPLFLQELPQRQRELADWGTPSTPTHSEQTPAQAHQAQGRQAVGGSPEAACLDRATCRILKGQCGHPPPLTVTSQDLRLCNTRGQLITDTDHSAV